MSVLVSSLRCLLEISYVWNKTCFNDKCKAVVCVLWSPSPACHRIDIHSLSDSLCFVKPFTRDWWIKLSLVDVSWQAIEQCSVLCVTWNPVKLWVNFFFYFLLWALFFFPGGSLHVVCIIFPPISPFYTKFFTSNLH